MTPAESAASTATSEHALWDVETPGGRVRRSVRSLANKAAVDPIALKAYQAYLSGTLSITGALIDSGLKAPRILEDSRKVINKLAPSAKELAKEEGLKPDAFVQFALNYVVDQFKDGIPPDLLEKYVQESPAL